MSVPTTPKYRVIGDPQTPASHGSSHENGGLDEISVAGLSGLLADGQTPLAHATSHQSGGSDAIKLDDFATPDDNTDLDASTLRHGLMMKYPGGTTTYLRADGSFAAVAASAGDFDKQISGTSTIAANKSRSIVNRLYIPSGTHLVIEDTGSLGIQ